MFRIRAIVILLTIAAAVYWLMPAHRKKRIRGKLREIWVATMVAIVLYWAYMLGSAAWKQWGGKLW
jgi:hypothetical protein